MALVLLAVTVSCCAVVVRTGASVVSGARAQAAADAVALAFVTGGRDAALLVASRSGAVIVSSVDDGNTVAVVVRSAGTSRSSTAARAIITGG